MARLTKKQTVEPAAEKTVVPSETIKTVDIAQPEIPTQIAAIMRLYPQYEELWITPKGFVHPKDVPAYLTKGATLYQNQFFKQ